MCTLVVLSSIALACSSVVCQDLDKGAKALNMIGDFANKLCNNPEFRGKSSSVEVQGKAKAEASKLGASWPAGRARTRDNWSARQRHWSFRGPLPAST